MQEFDVRFRGHLSSNVPLVDRVMGYMVKRKGKQLRPILVFLTAKMLGGVKDSTYVGASLIELMHTATHTMMSWMMQICVAASFQLMRYGKIR